MSSDTAAAVAPAALAQALQHQQEQALGMRKNGMQHDSIGHFSDVLSLINS